MLINDRFEIDRLRGEVTDRSTGTLNRIEPRLMKLLCLLAENSEKPVSRKMIVEQIWNNYPGGDEGLNQAISVLRKLLNDNEKRVIETLPKIGYCFHGTTIANPIVTNPKSLRTIYIPIVLFLVLTIVFTIGYYQRKEASNKIVSSKLSRDESVKAFKLDAKEGIGTLKMDSIGKLDSKNGARNLKMDSMGKLDSKEIGQSSRKDDEERRLQGEADSRKN